MKIAFEDLIYLHRRHKRKTTVFMGGVFDLVHRGHIERLRYAKKQGQVVVVGVSADQSVKLRKGNDRPIQPQEDRLAIIEAMGDVDYAFIMPLAKNGSSPTMQVLEALRPSFYIESPEYRQAWSEDMHKLHDLGVKLLFDPGKKRNSTSSMIDKIRRVKN